MYFFLMAAAPTIAHHFCISLYAGQYSSETNFLPSNVQYQQFPDGVVSQSHPQPLHPRGPLQARKKSQQHDSTTGAEANSVMQSAVVVKVTFVVSCIVFDNVWLSMQMSLIIHQSLATYLNYHVHQSCFDMIYVPQQQTNRVKCA